MQIIINPSNPMMMVQVVERGKTLLRMLSCAPMLCAIYGGMVCAHGTLKPACWSNAKPRGVFHNIYSRETLQAGTK
jgi:hypothetical protein